MTAIGGSGGVGGPTGPSGPSGPSSPNAADGVADLDEVSAETAPDRVDRADGPAQGPGQIDAAAQTRGAGDVDALAADVAAGRLTRDEAVDRLIEATAGPGLDASERAELRELLGDLVANDPYLGGLIGRM
jgi:hypothetical protein